MTPSRMPYITVRDLRKNFAHVVALQGASLDIYEAEIVALVGDNGAGKSTLIKILSGTYPADSGEILINGQPAEIANPQRARELGIATVFQNLALVDMRDVVANLFLGREPVRWRWFVDRRTMNERARAILSDLRASIPSLSAEVGQLSGGQRQSIAIGRASAQKGRIIIMDEPTAALGVQETRKVIDLILRLKAAGTGVVLISHNMPQVFEIADRIVVLRRGQTVGTRNRAETTQDEIVKLIVGTDSEGPAS